MVVKFRNTIWPPPHRNSPFIGELRCQAIQMEHAPYIAERTRNAVYIVRCLCSPDEKGGGGVLWIETTGIVVSLLATLAETIGKSEHSRI
jgi:hypothetical protein